jgi:hypothetical protein
VGVLQFLLQALEGPLVTRRGNLRRPQIDRPIAKRVREPQARLLGEPGDHTLADQDLLSR